MIGDTNLFLTDPDDRTVAEIEIMIAETAFRNSGKGKESTLLMLKYGELLDQQKSYKHQVFINTI